MTTTNQPLSDGSPIQQSRMKRLIERFREPANSFPEVVIHQDQIPKREKLRSKAVREMADGTKLRAFPLQKLTIGIPFTDLFLHFGGKDVLTFSRLKMNRAGRALAFFARRQQKEQERRSQRTNPDIAPSPQRAPQPTRSRPQDRSPTLTPATPQQGMRTAEESSPAAIMTASLPPRFDAATARQQAGLPEPPPRYEASPYEASPYPTPPPPRRGAVPPVPEM